MFQAIRRLCSCVDYGDPREFGSVMSEAIHLYIPSFAGGGAERVFVRLANDFARTGIRTRFVVNNSNGPLRNLLSDQVELVELGADRTRNAIVAFTRFMVRDRPAIVICALTFNNLTALVARALSGSRTKLIICERNQLSHVLLESNWVRRLVVLGLIRALYPRADVIATVSNGVAKDVARLSGVPLRRIHVIQNPAPDENEIAKARQSPVPHPWLGGQGPVAVAIGRLVRQKAYAVLMRAVAIVRRSIPLRLIILGDGPDREELVALAHELGIEEAVAFEGFVLNRLDYLVRASVYALSSEFEGSPNALVEAIACGVPVVSTDCAGEGPREILSPALDEALVPVNDADALAQALLGQLRKPSEAERIAQIARQFSLKRAADRYLRLTVE
jgi:glycosyltransferase involved in cell wall biosynthesis